MLAFLKYVFGQELSFFYKNKCSLFYLAHGLFYVLQRAPTRQGSRFGDVVVMEKAVKLAGKVEAVMTTVLII